MSFFLKILKVIPLIILDTKLKRNQTCSCTIEWLFQYSAKYLYDNEFEQYHSYISDCLSFDSDKNLKTECDFKSLTLSCKKKETKWNSLKLVSACVGVFLGVFIISLMVFFIFCKFFLKKIVLTNTHAPLINELDNETNFE